MTWMISPLEYIVSPGGLDLILGEVKLDFLGSLSDSHKLKSRFINIGRWPFCYRIRGI